MGRLRPALIGACADPQCTVTLDLTDAIVLQHGDSGCASLDRPASTPARVPSPSSRADPLSVAGFAHLRSLGLAVFKTEPLVGFRRGPPPPMLSKATLVVLGGAAADLEPDGLPVGTAAPPPIDSQGDS